MLKCRKHCMKLLEVIIKLSRVVVMIHFTVASRNRNHGVTSPHLWIRSTGTILLGFSKSLRSNDDLLGNVFLNKDQV